MSMFFPQLTTPPHFKTYRVYQEQFPSLIEEVKAPTGQRAIKRMRRLHPELGLLRAELVAS